MSWALQQEGMTSAQKIVLVVLANHYNEKVHAAWPSHGTLARQSSLDRSTVIRALTALQDTLGLVEITKGEDRNGRQTSNRYRLPDFDPTPPTVQ